MSLKSDSSYRCNHLVGWLAIAASAKQCGIERKIHLGLDGFLGDYGSSRVVETDEAFAFGFLQPLAPLPLTTWSLCSDEEGTCFIEGVFYDAYFSHQPVDGADPQLAKILLKRFRADGANAIKELSGSFSGFIYDRKERRLGTFVDRFGTKVLYWSNEKDHTIVSSNLASFRHLKTLQIDQHGTFQSLTLGFPIGERTLLKDVKIQLPGSVNTFHNGKQKSVRYWSPPERIRNLSLRDSCLLITNSLEEYAERIFRRTQRPLGLGLSGGHDSRVILSALAYKNVPFEALTWRDGNFNDRVAEQLCAVLKKPSRVVQNLSNGHLTQIRQDSFVYSDGHYFYPAGFPRLGKECLALGIDFLLIGFAGDVISGAALSYPAPEYLRTIDQLAHQTLRVNQSDYMPFELAKSVLIDAKSSLPEETISEWVRTFSEDESHESLVDVSIFQGLANREFKRVRFAIAPVARYVQLIFPYLDNNVMDAYFRLPFSALRHRVAHCYAGFYRFKQFGAYQAGSYPISLKNEARFSHSLYLTKACVARLKELLSSLPVRRARRGRNDLQSIFEELSRSDLVDGGRTKQLFVNGELTPRSLYKIHTLSRFFDFYLHGNNSHLPQRFSFQ